MGRTLVAVRILEQVKLVIVLCIPPLRGLLYLGDDLFALGGKVFRLDLLCHALRDGLLFWGIREDRRAVFCGGRQRRKKRL
jgi:hypothetical protein